MRDMPKQSGENRSMHRFVVTIGCILRPARVGNTIAVRRTWSVFPDRILELPINVPPFPHSRRREKVGFAKSAHRVAAALAFGSRCGPPDVEEGKKIRLGMRKCFVSRCRCFLL